MIQPYDVIKAAENGRRAIRRGDVDAAERWFRIAERAAAIAQRLSAITRNETLASLPWRRNPV
mgnify:CR=1 FL=1